MGEWLWETKVFTTIHLCHSTIVHTIFLFNMLHRIKMFGNIKKWAKIMFGNTKFFIIKCFQTLFERNSHNIV